MVRYRDREIPTTINGLEWKQPETTMASVGPPVMKPILEVEIFGTILCER